MDKPSFLIIGTPRAGTTALYSFLKSHPEISGLKNKKKEPNYFSTDLIRESDEYHGNSNHEERFSLRDQDAYLEYFENLSSSTAAGEASVSYIYSREAPENIHRFNKDMKILVIFREPVSFLRSYYKHVVMLGKETSKDIVSALRQEPARRKGRRLNSLIAAPSDLYYTDKIRYAHHLQRYLDVFDEDQIKVIIYDDFKKDNEGVYAEVCSFLGVDPSYKPDFKSINANKQVVLPSIRSFAQSRAIWSVPKALLPQKAYLSLKRGFDRLTIKKKPRTQLSPKKKKFLRKLCAPEVRELSKLVKRDLVSLWGYEDLIDEQS